MSKSLDALIAAIFARIFARLEQILRLWQSGKLPPPPIRPQTSPCTNRSFAPRRATKPGFRPRSPTPIVILSSAKDPRSFFPYYQSTSQKHPSIISHPTLPAKRIKFFCFFLFTKRRLPSLKTFLTPLAPPHQTLYITD